MTEFLLSPENSNDIRHFIGGVALAFLLAVLAHLALARPERRATRLSFILLALFVVLRLVEWAERFGPRVDHLLHAVEVFAYLGSVSRSLMLLVVHGIWRRAFGKSLPRILVDLLQGGLFIAIALVALTELGLEPTSLLATSAVLTAVLGLSLQETLGNLFAGLAIQGEQPFEVGDWIQFDQTERSGRVLEINWRATKIETADRVVITVPNGVLARAPIANYSRPEPYSRRFVVVDVPYDAPAGIASLLTKAARRADGVCEVPAPDALIVEFAESGIRYRVRYFISDHSRWTEVAGNVLANVFAALRRRQIEIPYPVRRVQVERSRRADHQRSDVERIRRYLMDVSIVSELSEESQELLTLGSRFARYAKHERVVRQGDPGDELFLVTHGLVRVQLDTGERLTQIATLGPGEFFGEMSLLTGDVRAASVYAEMETELLIIGHDALVAVFERDTSALEILAPAVARRQAELSAHLQSGGSVYPPEESQQLIGRIRTFFGLGRG